MHLSKKLVEVGETVYEGQVFALSGNTGFQSPGKHYILIYTLMAQIKRNDGESIGTYIWHKVSNEVFFTIYGSDYLNLKAAKEAGTVAPATTPSISNAIKPFTIRRINLLDRSKDNTRIKTMN
jgi:murein DD-endopeptidase MepM/ murein hydrolase activator NlpD